MSRASNGVPDSREFPEPRESGSTPNPGFFLGDPVGFLLIYYYQSVALNRNKIVKSIDVFTLKKKQRLDNLPRWKYQLFRDFFLYGQISSFINYKKVRNSSSERMIKIEMKMEVFEKSFFS